LASFVLITVPLLACTLDNNPSGSCDEYDPSSNCYDGYNYGDNGSGYDSGVSTSPSSECTSSFGITFDAPASSGDCKLTIASYDATFDYFFATPEADDAREPCAAFGGPVPGECFRELGTIAFGSTSADDASALANALGYGTASFTATLSCAHGTATPPQDVGFTCEPNASAGDDAGASSFGDASSSANGDAGAKGDAASSADAGCGP
jgi:hypothetical protein